LQCGGIETIEICKYIHNGEPQVPKLNEENQVFWFFYTKLTPGFYNPFGGYNYSAIEFLFEIYGIEEPLRDIYMDKILILIQVIEEYREQ
jgi:hypothetical protein